MLFNNTMVEKINHISKVTLKMLSYDYVKNRNIAVAAKEYTEIFQDAEMTLFQPLELEEGILVKMDPCTTHKNLWLVVKCTVGATINSPNFNYIPLQYIQDNLDTWICKQDNTTIWMNTLSSKNDHAKKCIQHVNLYQDGRLNKIVNGWNIVEPISDAGVNLTITLPHCTETLEVKLDQCSVSVERPEYEVNDQFETNSSGAIRNVSELLSDSSITKDKGRNLSFAKDELTKDHDVRLSHVYYIWIGVSALAAVCIVAIIVMISLKVRRLRHDKKQSNIDTNPEYGDGSDEYYRQTEICDSNEAYYQF